MQLPIEILDMCLQYGVHKFQFTKLCKTEDIHLSNAISLVTLRVSGVWLHNEQVGHHLTISLACCQVTENFYFTFAFNMVVLWNSEASRTLPINSLSISLLSCTRGPGRPESHLCV